MRHTSFNKLKVGDFVTLASAQSVYGCRFPDTDGIVHRRVFIREGSEGVVGATKVPTVTGKSRFFACVDFPPTINIFDEKGNKLSIQNPHNNSYRVAAYPEELK